MSITSSPAAAAQLDVTRWLKWPVRSEERRVGKEC